MQSRSPRKPQRQERRPERKPERRPDRRNQEPKLQDRGKQPFNPVTPKNPKAVGGSGNKISDTICIGNLPPNVLLHEFRWQENGCRNFSQNVGASSPCNLLKRTLESRPIFSSIARKMLLMEKWCMRTAQFKAMKLRFNS